MLALTGMLGIGAFAVACTTTTAAAPTDDDDDTEDDDDSEADDDDDKGKTDAGKSSSSSSSSSSGSPVPVDSGPPPKSALTFFVTSVAGGTGGNLGGLTGADAKCLELATAVKAGDHTWAAFLSIQGTNAKDRIGPGPWKNQKGEVVATNVEGLFDFVHPPADSLWIDEKGAALPDTERYILTGTGPDGNTNLNRNCQGWTSNANNQAVSYGDTKATTAPVAGTTWSFAKNMDTNCGANLRGQGRIFCFAKD